MYYNPYLIVPFATWVIAQAVKFSLAALRGRVDFKYLYASGGMPSAHSAVVSALATTAFFVSGPASPIFGLATVFAAIVMYDSFGVRRASGEQAAAINMLIESLELDRVKLRQPTLKLREILGHRPLEVTVGAVMGILLGCLFNLNHLSAQLAWMSTQSGKLEFRVYLVLVILTLVASFGLRQWLKQRYGKSRAIRTLSKHLFVMTLSVGLLGLLLVFAQYEKLPYFSWRIWIILVALILVSWSAWIYGRFHSLLPQALAAEADEARRRKWLAPKRKKKR